MSPEPPPPRVFISYAHDATSGHNDRVLALSEQLRADGIDTILDQYIQAPPEGWQRWMLNQVDEADFILLICTEPYCQRFEGRATPGQGRGVIREGTLIDQALYDHSDRNERFIPVLLQKADQAHIPRVLRPTTSYAPHNPDGYERLYRRLTGQPEVIPGPVGNRKAMPTKPRPAFGATPPPTHQPWNVPLDRNPAFTGRDDVLTALRTSLTQQGQAAISQVQAISGLGGIGKTQTAVEYAYRHRQDYTAVLWVAAATATDLAANYAALTNVLSLELPTNAKQDDRIAAVRHWLTQHAGWLLIFDNADHPEWLDSYLPRPRDGHVLLTSRAITFDALGLFAPIALDVLTPEDARSFFARRLGRDHLNPAQIVTVDELAKEVEYLPLALEQAAAYVSATKTTLPNYLTSFRALRLTILEKHGPGTGKYPASVAKTWKLNVAEVEQSPESALVLRVCAFLAPDAIPIELFTRGAAALPQPLLQIAQRAADMPVLLDELLAPLLRFSLMQRVGEQGSLRMHRLVQEVIRESLSDQDQREMANLSVEVVSAAFSDVEFSQWPWCRSLLPHAEQCARWVQRFDLFTARAALLLNQAAVFQWEQASYESAETLHRSALAIRECTLGPDHAATAGSLNNLARLLHDCGKLDQAEPLLRRALTIVERALGPDHPATATSLNNLALLLQDANQLEEAEPLVRRALAIDEAAYGNGHPEVATDLNNLASLLQARGQLDEAEPLFQFALAIREQALGPDHPDTAQSLNNLAHLLCARGELDEAEPLVRRALAICERALGAAHPTTVILRGNLESFHQQ